ncbi:MAG TPA: group 1 truncated hemoglobin [Tepidisphaeraceae bacterium]|nr:group 1 truncated hemoglobin [Tepidisphaeraceae bacterium]
MKTMTGWFLMVLVTAAIAGAAGAGCGSSQAQEDRDFYTSGSREADQRAEQRVARDEQMKAGGDASSDKEKKNDPGKADVVPGSKDAQVNAKKSLYDRLGGQDGLTKIVDDFMARALADPRVNWERKGVTRGGISLSRNQSVEWQASDQNVATLKKHVVQFLALATGGPTTYEGKEMKAAHAGKHITNPEFDATIGDLKATLDKLGVPTDEQKELLAIIESTRPQVVEER